jgi:hypothetical protein
MRHLSLHHQMMYKSGKFNLIMRLISDSITNHYLGIFIKTLCNAIHRFLY